MIKDFLEPYFEESELKKLKEIVSKAKELKRTHGTSQEELDKVLFSLRYEIISLETKAFSRYTKQRDDTAILKDCLEIIQAVEPKDFSNNKFLSKKQPSDIVKFSFSISNNTDISYIENYFSETKNNGAISKIWFAIYDRTLEFYPDGFSDQDKKSSFCIFDKAFFKALTDREHKELIIDTSENSKRINGFVKSLNSPMVRALQELTNAPKRQLEEPGQISLFESGLQVDVWNESVEQSPNARKITSTKTSINGTEFRLVYAVEDYKPLLKGNVVASKFLSFMSEKALEIKQNQNQDSIMYISIREFAERLEIDIKDARAALKTASNIFKIIKYETEDGDYIYIFPAFVVGKKTLPNGKKIGVTGHVTVETSSFVDLSEGGKYTKYTPKYIWQLKGNAWFLANYIYSVLRQDAKNVNPDCKSHKKRFDFLTVLPVLDLPHPSETNQITRWILEPIKKAVDEINKIETKNHGSLHLDYVVDNQKPLFEQVSGGYIEVTVKDGAYLDSLKETSQKRLTHKADSLKRQQEKEKRIDAAKGREQARQETRNKKKEEQN